MKQQIKRKVPIIKENDQWKLHQLFRNFTQSLDRLPDAGEVQRNRQGAHRRASYQWFSEDPFSAVLGDTGKELQAGGSGVFRSLASLCSTYTLPVPDVSAIDFPMNVCTAFMKVKEALKKKDKTADCIIIRDDSHQATLAVLKRYDTGMCSIIFRCDPYGTWYRPHSSSRWRKCCYRCMPTCIR